MQAANLPAPDSNSAQPEWSAALSGRVVKLAYEGNPAVMKWARDDDARNGLAQEWQRLTSVRAPYAPTPLAYDASCEEAVLVREFVDGQTLDALAEPPLARDVLELLFDVHDRGLIFCDLRPENVLRRETGELMLLDWEYAAPRGAPIESMARRPFSYGWTHPDLIWARGNLRPEIDIMAVQRMVNRGLLANQKAVA